MQLTKSQKEIINGSLLGDGCLAPRKNRKNARLSIQRKLDDIKYLEWQFSFLKDLCGTDIKTKSYLDKRTNKTYRSCYFTTLSSKELTTISKKWYSNGVKYVPEDLVLTPLCLGVWFLDDGNIRYTSSKNAIQLTISTQSFSKKEVNFLADKLSSKFKGYFGVYPNKDRFVISCSTQPGKNLLKYILPILPIKTMVRKTSIMKAILKKEEG